MAKYEVNCQKCGGAYTVQLFGKTKDRERKINNWRGFCEDCKEKEWEEKKEKTYQNSLKLQKEIGLPPLTGSEKQIKWAESIRANFWKAYEQDQDVFNSFIKIIFDRYSPTDEIFLHKKEEHRCSYVENEEIVNSIFNHTESRYWIDNRGNLLSEIAKTEKMLKPNHLKSKSEIEIEMQVKEEATIYPKEPATNLKIEILEKEGYINIVYPEKNDSFYSLIKSYDFTWNSSSRSWQVILDKNKNYDFYLNMLTDLCSNFLKKGFPIITLNEDLKQKILNHDFTPYSNNWVYQRTNGDYKNWFVLEWAYPSNYYNEAKKLSGSLYHHKKVLVPPQSYEEVIDFAKINNFNFSDGAKSLIEAMKKITSSKNLITYIEKENSINTNNEGSLDEVLNSLKDNK
jgi:hypothetical protein